MRKATHLLFAAAATLWAALGADAQSSRTQSSGTHSPHRVAYVTRDGARLHYLTWGTAGPVVILLPGFSLTAHAYDDIGPLLASGHRVIALTPRGFGESDAPDSSAYIIETLVGDLRALMDSLHVERAALVAHSISGTVASHFALRYPARVSQLVLLDAFPYYGAAGGDSVASLDPVSAPPFSGDTTYDNAAAYLARYRFVPWRPALDADLRARPIGPENERRLALTVQYIDDQWRHAPDLARLTVPALQVCAVASVASEYPWLARTDSAYARARTYIERHLAPFNRALCQRFQDTVPRGRVVRLAGSHYVFFTQPQQTVRILRSALTRMR